MSTPRAVGDAAACSVAGGVLRQGASRLGAQVDDLGVALDAASRASGPAATLAGSARPAVVPAEALVRWLDALGIALQRHAVELADIAESRRVLARRAEAAGLCLQDWRVLEPYGVASVERAGARQRELAPLQHRVDQLHSRLAKAQLALELAARERPLGVGAHVDQSRRGPVR